MTITTVSNPADLIPLDVLALTLPTPVVGWGIELDRRGVSIMRDHIGRDAITIADAREMVAEQRENEARLVRMRQQAEQRAVEADRQFRASLNPGIPWYVIGRDVTPAAAILEAQQDADYAGRPRSVAAELLEAEFAGGTSLEYHPIGPDSA